MLRSFDVERSGRVLVARYTRPPHNFLDGTAVRELDLLTRQVNRDRDVGAVVLTGGPPGRFITHFDVAELTATAELPARVPALRPGPLLGEVAVRAGLGTTRWPWAQAAAERFGPLGRGLATLSRFHHVIRRMHGSHAVWIAAIGGPCLGAGLELALACDLRLAADDPGVALGQPEILGGIIPGAGGTQHLPRVVGTAHALELILDGRSVDAAEALRLGLLSRVVAPADLAPAAAALAARLATRPPAAVAAAKRAVYVGSARAIRRGLLVEGGGLISAGATGIVHRVGTSFAADLERLGESPFVAEPEPWFNGRRAGEAATGPRPSRTPPRTQGSFDPPGWPKEP